MVALVIAGLALAAVFRAATESNNATSAAAHYQEAVSRARSHLDGTTANLVPGEQEGDDGGGFHWRVVVRAVDSTGKRDAAGRSIASADSLVVTLYAVTVWITWREGATNRSVQLDSERLLTSRRADGQGCARPFAGHLRRSDFNRMHLAWLRRGNVDPAWHRIAGACHGGGMRHGETARLHAAGTSGGACRTRPSDGRPGSGAAARRFGLDHTDQATGGPRRPGCRRTGRCAR